MTQYEELLVEAERLGLKVREAAFGNKECGYIKNDRILINKNLLDKQKYVVLAEEIGHYHKTVGDITDQSKIENRKQEKIARRWSYEKLIGIIDIINAHDYGCKNLYEMSEYLGVTEKFLQATIQHYKETKGPIYQIDQYTVYFEPSFGVLKMFK